MSSIRCHRAPDRSLWESEEVHLEHRRLAQGDADKVCQMMIKICFITCYKYRIGVDWLLLVVVIYSMMCMKGSARLCCKNRGYHELQYLIGPSLFKAWENLSISWLWIIICCKT